MPLPLNPRKCCPEVEWALTRHWLCWQLHFWTPPASKTVRNKVLLLQKKKRAGGVPQRVENLLTKCEASRSNSNTTLAQQKKGIIWKGMVSKTC
jgi:hypothetical protein